MTIQHHRLGVYLGVVVLIGCVPGAAHGGLFTSPVNPTYNVGPESAYLNPAGMTGVKTTSVSAGAAVLVPIFEFDVDFAGEGGGDGGNSG